ncbi:MAG TPA: hypothetical protein VFS04_08970, partial [Alphaproteobacteria bacterium]|nr:hypothetical protein [Alphaproteobacteria bacterium]
MKMPLRRRYALAFLSLAAVIIAVFAVLMTVQAARQQTLTTRASLQVMATTIDVVSADRARLVAELTAGAFADIIERGPAAIATRAANLRSRDNFMLLRLFDAS